MSVARRISTKMMRPDLSHSPRLISTPFRQSRVLLVWTLILFDPNTAHHHEADERGDKPDHAKDTGKHVAHGLLTAGIEFSATVAQFVSGATCVPVSGYKRQQDGEAGQHVHGVVGVSG
jgi:hypothetical protein